MASVSLLDLCGPVKVSNGTILQWGKKTEYVEYIIVDGLHILNFCVNKHAIQCVIHTQ